MPRLASESRASFPIVGIVASAGGLDALNRFFSTLPEECPFAIVVVPHLDTKHKSSMVDLLGRQTSIPIVEAQSEMVIELNRIYVIPSNQLMTIHEGKLQLSDFPNPIGTQTAIDIFLRSLAEDVREQSVGIVLSGTGSHGTLGLREIKSNGGMTMAQSSSSAEFDQMPQSAIDAGLIDFVLPPEQMPGTLLNYLKQVIPQVYDDSPPATAKDAEELRIILQLIVERTKYDFSSYRPNMLLRRIERRMGLLQIVEMSLYTQTLRDQPAEIHALCRDFLIGVTSFFRDPEAFEILESQIIPELIDRKPEGNPIRIWVPSCASGEEAYSIAILMIEALTKLNRPLHFQVFASDISEGSIQFARRGIYTSSVISDLTSTRLHQFFISTDNVHFKVSKQLRDTIVFSQQDLVSDAPFSKMDLISCRNLLIYLEPSKQQKLISLFHFSLNDSGYLLLGPAETIGRDQNLFEAVSRKWRIYHRLRLPQQPTTPVPFAQKESGSKALVQSFLLPQKRTYKETAERLILSDYSPATVLINRHHEILNVTGPLVDYLEFPAGEVTRDLLAMARTGLRAKLRSACQKALQKRIEVVDADARVKRNNNYFRCTIRVRPISDGRQPNDLLLVLFQDQGDEEKIAQPSETTFFSTESLKDSETTLIDVLDRELKSTREELQNTVESMSCANEELQSSNEELESSKEELQSLNEELNTVNCQLLEKVNELDQINLEIGNLMSSMEIATIYLDENLRIKRFTPPAVDLLQLAPDDKGRHLTQHDSPLFNDNMLSDCRKVLNHKTKVESEVITADNQYFLRRISPFRLADGQTNGIVVTFLDLTERKKSEAKQREQDARFRNVFEHGATGISITDWNGISQQCNPAYCNLLGMSAEEIVGKSCLSFVHEADRENERLLSRQLITGERTSFEIESRLVCKTGQSVWVRKFVSVLPDESGNPAYLVELITNISAQRMAAAELRESEEKTRAILASLSSHIAVLDGNGVIVDTNPAWQNLVEEQIRYSTTPSVGVNYLEILDENARSEKTDGISAQVATGLRNLLSGAIDDFGIEYPLNTESSQRWFLLQATPLRHRKGGAVVSHYEITKRVLLEQKSVENQKLLQLVMDTVPHYIYAKNREGLFVFVNKHMASQNGFPSPLAMVTASQSETELEGKQNSSLDDAEKSVLETGNSLFSKEETLVDAAGISHFVQSSKLRFELPGSNALTLLGVSVDITERKQAELKVRENAERLRAILNTASDAIITINSRGIIDSVNQATIKMFGYENLELIGKNVSMLMPLPFRTENDSYIQRYVRTGEAHIIGSGREVLCRRKDGSTFPADLAVSQVDHLGLFTGVLRDISSRKEMQRHTLEIVANEQRRIGLELHDGTQQELTGLTLYASAMIETINSAKPAESDSPETPSNWQFSSTEFLRLQSTAKLMVTRLKEANGHVRDLAHGIMPVQIDAEGLRSALGELADSINSESVTCEFKFHGKLKKLDNTIATHLYRIAQEATSNSLRHSSATWIGLSLSQVGDRVTLEINDNGTGMSSQTSDEIGTNHHGMGLRTMEYRASMIGGVVQFLKGKNGGTIVRCVASVMEVNTHD